MGKVRDTTKVNVRKRSATFVGSVFLTGFLAITFNQAIAQGLGSLPMTYSGRLTESSGAPKDGPVAIEATFWTAEIDGTQLGQTFEFASVILNQGVFSLYFPFMASQVQDIFRDGTEPVFIEISSGGKAYPRQKFNYIPLAMRIPVDNKTLSFDTASGQLGIKNAKTATSGSVLVSDGTGGVKWDNLSSANLTAKTQAGGEPAADQVLTYKSGKWVAASLPPAAASGNYLTGLTGDIVATGPGTGTATLATVATPGTATKVTYDAKGRVTSGTSLVATDINAALGFSPLNKAGDTVTGDLSLSQLSLPATTAPALSSSGQGRIYFDQSTSEFKVSQNGSAYTKLATGGSVTSVATGAGLTGGPITNSGTISLSSTGVSAGSYTRASVSVDAQGRITGAVNGGNINLATEVSSTLGVANGGTGATNFTANGVVLGNGAGNLLTTGAGSADQILRVPTAGGVPSFGALNLASTSAVSGVLPLARGGTGVDLSGTGGSGQFLKQTANGGTVTVATILASEIPSLPATKIPQASNTADGYLAASDWSTFNAKQNALGYAPLNKAGDTMSGAIDMNGNALANVGNLRLASDKTFGLGRFDNASEANMVTTLIGGGASSPDKGKTWFNTSTNEIKYWDGQAAKALGISGAGLTNLGGLTDSTQSFGTSTSGNTLGFSPVGTVHTLNIPMASGGAGVAAGLISNADYAAFSNKVSSVAAGTGIAVSPASGTVTVSLASIGTAGTYAKVVTNASGQVVGNAALVSADIPNLDAAKITTGQVSVANGGTGIGFGNSGGLPYFSGVSTMASSMPLTSNGIVLGGGVGGAPTSTAALSNGQLLIGSTGNAPVPATLSSGANGGVTVATGAGTVTLDTPQDIKTSASPNFAGLTLSGVTANALVKTNGSKALVAASGSDVTGALGFTPANKAGDTFTGAVSVPIIQQAGTTQPALSAAGQGSIYFDSGSNQFKVSQNGGAYTPLATGGSVTSVATGTGLTGGPVTTTGIISLANTAVTPGAYTRANITVDQQGRLTAAANGSNVNLATEVTGILPTANGGTGLNSAATFPTSGVVVTRDATETLLNKTLTAPVVSSLVNTGTLTLPTSTDTLVGRATTDTLTNKTLTGATINGASSIAGSTSINTTGTATTGILTASTVTSQGNVTVQGNGTSANKLVLNDKANTNYVAFKAPDTLASQLTWELPGTNGTAGQVLSTNGTGTLSWVSGVAPTGAASGDLTGNFPGPTLAAVGTAGTYMKVTTDTKGRVISGATLTASDLPPISASSLNTGTLAVANGGTGVGAFTNNGVVIGSSSALSSTAAGTQYNILTVNASNQPTFGTVNLASSNAVNGTLGVANGGTGVNSTATFPTSGVVVTRDATETLSNKTLTAPVVGTIVNTGTLTLPSSTDTLVGRATTDTLTNKTLSGATINGASSIGGSTTINTTGTATTGALTASTVTSQGSVTVQGNGANANKLVLNDKANTNYVAFKAPDTLASQLTWELPGTNGTAGQVLSTNGTGTLSWVSGVAPTGTASGDLSGNFPGPTVATVGGKTSTAIATSVNDTVAATSAGTASTIVKRDASGNFTAGTITGTLSGNATNVTGTVAIANGGTGATTASAAFDALSPLTTIGDILYAGAGGADTRLVGNQSTTKQFLSSTGTGSAANAPVWAALTASDIPAHSASLITSGVLGVANGGTGAATTTANYVFAGPTTGTGAPTFRTLVAGDLPAMGGANGTAAGTAGAVPGPAATDNVKFLRGDGTWATPTAAAAGSTNQIQYNSGGVLTGNANFVYSGGNVGIGTTSPSALLHLQNGTNSTMLSIGSSYGSTTDESGIHFYRFSSGSNYIDSKTTTGGKTYFRTGQGTEGNAARTWMTVDAASGNVGIGTTNPSQLLSVAGIIESKTGGFKFPDGTTQITASGTASACPADFTTMESNGYRLGCIETNEHGTANCTVAASACFAVGGRLPSFSEIKTAFVNYSLTNENDDDEWVENSFYDSGSRACGVITPDGYPTGNPINTSGVAYRCFIPGNGAGVGDGTWSQNGGNIVRDTGNVGIGTTSPSYTLHVNGSVAGNGAYIALSDIRFKKDVQDLVGSLAKVLAIRGVSYKWIDEEKNGSGTQYGVIAQEIEKILPDVVVTGSDGIKRVKYDDLIPLIIEALKAEKASKDAEIAQLKARADRADAEAAQLKFRADQADAESARLKTESAQLKASLCGKFPDLPVCSN